MDEAEIANPEQINSRREILAIKSSRFFAEISLGIQQTTPE
jgi:hypothetical protein